MTVVLTNTHNVTTYIFSPPVTTDTEKCYETSGAIILCVNIHFSACEAEFVQFPGFGTEDAASSDRDPPQTPQEVTTKTILVREKANISQTEAIVENRTEIFSCPEEEQPSNIGPYEVPTQRDLVTHMKTKLLRLFKNYHSKALLFLKDIKQATRATSEIADKCPGYGRETYKKCVRHVSNQCQLITKSMVRSLEYQRRDVAAVTEGPICNMTAMKADPVELIKELAMEGVSLEFALPGFLRLLNACTVYCKSSNENYSIKPSRHMTDQDLVIRHFLTRKNYVQLIKGTQ